MNLSSLFGYFYDEDGEALEGSREFFSELKGFKDAEVSEESGDIPLICFVYHVDFH